MAASGSFLIRASVNIGPIMRCDPVPLLIPPHLVRDSRLYAPADVSDLDAVVYVLSDYPALVSELRQLRRRVAQLDVEGAAFDARLAELQALCLVILDF